MAKHDALATAAEWLTRHLNEEHRKRAVAAGTRQRLIDALVGPVYHQEAVERYLRERCSPALVRVIYALARLPQNRPPRNTPLESDQQLLRDAFDILFREENMSRRIGHLRLAALLQKTQPKRYRALDKRTLKKRLDRAFDRWDRFSLS